MKCADHLRLEAADNTNNKHLELYCVMAELHGAGYPLSYCMLSTQTAIDIGKRTKALTAWGKCLREKYGVIPRFCHSDNAMAQISMARTIWPTIKIQLCWWHLKKFLKQRLAKKDLATTPYNSRRAHTEFSWIRLDFVPPGQSDPNDYEGGCPDEDESPNQEQEVSVNTVMLRIPAT